MPSLIGLGLINSTSEFIYVLQCFVKSKLHFVNLWNIVIQWKRISCKQDTRWQNLSRLKASAFFSLQKISCMKCNKLYSGLVTPSSGWWSPIRPIKSVLLHLCNNVDTIILVVYFFLSKSLGCIYMSVFNCDFADDIIYSCIFIYYFFCATC